MIANNASSFRLFFYLQLFHPIGNLKKWLLIRKIENQQKSNCVAIESRRETSKPLHARLKWFEKITSSKSEKWKSLPFLAASVPQLHMNTKISSFRIVQLLAKWEIHIFYSVKEIQNWKDASRIPFVFRENQCQRWTRILNWIRHPCIDTESWFCPHKSHPTSRIWTNNHSQLWPSWWWRMRFWKV